MKTNRGYSIIVLISVVTVLISGGIGIMHGSVEFPAIEDSDFDDVDWEELEEEVIVAEALVAEEPDSIEEEESVDDTEEPEEVEEESVEEDIPEVEETSVLRVYRVRGRDLVLYGYEYEYDPDLEGYRNNTEMHERIWHMFFDLTPPEYRERIEYFIIYSDGYQGELAFVAQYEDRPVFFIDVLDFFDSQGNHRDYDQNIDTLTHEVGHLISLHRLDIEFAEPPLPEESVADYKTATRGCAGYLSLWGCTYKDSLLNIWYEKFWRDKYFNEHLYMLGKNPGERQTALSNFYYDNQSDFVSDYAATRLEEDFAETFMVYVWYSTPPDGTVAREKYDFIATYSGLSEAKNYIWNAEDGVYNMEADYVK